MITLFLCLLIFAIAVYVADKSSKPPTVGLEWSIKENKEDENDSRNK